MENKLIQKVSKCVCDATATALERYAEISGMIEKGMPEHFVVAHVMHILGNDMRSAEIR
jgi:hypothetical protein